LKNYGPPRALEIDDPWLEHKERKKDSIDPRSLFWKDVGVGKYHSVIANCDGSV